jgi:hypothetical protein
VLADVGEGKAGHAACRAVKAIEGKAGAQPAGLRMPGENRNADKNRRRLFSRRLEKALEKPQPRGVTFSLY